jgi:hypothetical protein
MGVIALTSMPSITPKMNWREWRLLQSQTGWLAVTTATVSPATHVHLHMHVHAGCNDQPHHFTYCTLCCSSGGNLFSDLQRPNTSGRVQGCTYA